MLLPRGTANVLGESEVSVDGVFGLFAAREKATGGQMRSKRRAYGRETPFGVKPLN